MTHILRRLFRARLRSDPSSPSTNDLHRSRRVLTRNATTAQDEACSRQLFAATTTPSYAEESAALRGGSSIAGSSEVYTGDVYTGDGVIAVPRVGEKTRARRRLSKRHRRPG